MKIEFEEQIWAQIIDMLAEHPYKRSGAIINTMAQQIQGQQIQGQQIQGQQTKDASNISVAKTNGGDSRNTPAEMRGK